MTCTDALVVSLIGLVVVSLVTEIVRR